MSLRFFSLLALVWLGCGGSTSTPQTVQQGVASLRAESQLHYANIMAMTSMTGVADEDSRHLRDSDDILGTMRGAMGTMGCNDTASMGGMMDQMDAMMSQYAAAMRSATDLGQAQQLTASHRDAMIQLCDGMYAAMASMHCSMMN